MAEPALVQLQKTTAEGGPVGLKPPPLKSLTLTADVSPGLTLVVTARPRREQDAESFGKQLEAVVTMGSAFAGDSPDIKKILEGLKVTRGAGEVKVTLTAPWDVLGKAFVDAAARCPRLGQRVRGHRQRPDDDQRADHLPGRERSPALGTVECLKSPESCVSGYSGSLVPRSGLRLSRREERLPVRHRLEPRPRRVRHDRGAREGGRDGKTVVLRRRSGNRSASTVTAAGASSERRAVPLGLRAGELGPGSGTSS